MCENCEKALKEACILLSEKIYCRECPANCFCEGVEIPQEVPEKQRCSWILFRYFKEVQNE